MSSIIIPIDNIYRAMVDIKYIIVILKKFGARETYDYHKNKYIYSYANKEIDECILESKEGVFVLSIQEIRKLNE